MSTLRQCDAAQHEDRASIEEILERFDSYIALQVKELVRQNPHIAHQAVLDLEIDDLIQKVRIKLWRALKEKDIAYPKSYIWRIVRNKFVDMIRRMKPLYALAVDQDGEIYYGNVLVQSGAGMADPLDEVERQDEVANCMDKTVDAVLKLPDRQQLAMICSLRERVDDFIQLASAFKMRRIDIEGLQWPQEKSEKQVLQASLSCARRKVAAHLHDILAC